MPNRAARRQSKQETKIKIQPWSRWEIWSAAIIVVPLVGLALFVLGTQLSFAFTGRCLMCTVNGKAVCPPAHHLHRSGQKHSDAPNK